VALFCAYTAKFVICGLAFSAAVDTPTFAAGCGSFREHPAALTAKPANTAIARLSSDEKRAQR
jgi:hypothetical protein